MYNRVQDLITLWSWCSQSNANFACASGNATVKSQSFASRLREQIFELKKLEYLNVSFNYITSISDNISNLINLQALVAINKTEIEGIGNGFGELINLKQLFIKTYLGKISNQLIKLQRLETIENIRISKNDYQFLDIFKNINLISKLKIDYVSDNYSALTGQDFNAIENEVKSLINASSNKNIEISVSVVDINRVPSY